MGQEFGTSISTVAGTMELVAQQGKKQADIISITRTATMAANVTNLDAAEAIDTITAAMKAFQMQGTQSMRVLDSWNELENTTGVSAKTLAEATKYAGAAAGTPAWTSTNSMASWRPSRRPPAKAASRSARSSG